MALLDNLLKYVRSGTAEGDRPFLGETFVSPTQFDQLCAIEPGSMRLLIGNKGIGKSAVVEWIAKVSDKKKIPCLLIRPDNIITTPQPTSFDIGSLKSYYYDVLLRTIASKIGSNLKGFLKGDAARLYNEAKQRGIAQGDIIQTTLELISAISLPVSKVNGVQLAKDLAASNSAQNLTSAINRQLLSSGSVFYLLIDDTDQLAAPDQATHLNRIWGLILAVRRLAGECMAVRPIVSLRASVWTRLTTESLGQRDQTDHMRGLVIPLLADDKLMQAIIRRRLERAAVDAGFARTDPYPVFFEGNEMTLPTSDARRSWQSFITKSARERPRDAIQLIKNMIDAANSESHVKIGSADANKAMALYSSERVDDVVNEFSIDCKNIREIIDSLADCDFDSNFESIRRHMRTVPSITSLSVRGTQMRPEVDDDAIILLELMHEAGVINPRVPDRTKDRDFRHINFHDDPSFVRTSNWNDMQGATWEIHPAFRTYLLGVKQARVNRILMPATSRQR
ncbi:P-loop ATPase, Sll1717 family [Variovorax sp. AFSI2.2]|uniref:P-loop ATPase, Sll1717 family n=1 Tax=Variovorax sp. AFSI2.2 TaxID=3384160 RepID=UPI003EB924BF